MTVNYTTNLALGQPVTGTESGTWGDDVNNSVTSYLDIAIAGGLSVTVTTADITLVLTQGTSSATNIGSTTAQYAILNVSGAMTAARNLILPSSSRVYVINNNTTGGFALTVKGSATSGVTMVNGEKAHVFWNGSDYAKLSNTPGGTGSFTDLTVSGSVTLSGGTANGVTYLNGSKVLTSGSAFVFDGTNVGIGITAPAYKLVVSSAGASGIEFGPAFSGTANLIQSYSRSGGVYVDTVYEAAQHRFNIAGSEKARIDSSGNVGIGTSSPSASAILDAQSTTKGVRMPNMTTTQKNAISSPAAGLMVFDTTLAKLCVYSGSAWQTVTSI